MHWIDGKALSAHIRTAWEGIREDAGLGADVVPHVMRHTAVTWSMQQAPTSGKRPACSASLWKCWSRFMATITPTSRRVRRARSVASADRTRRELRTVSHRIDHWPCARDSQGNGCAPGTATSFPAHSILRAARAHGPHHSHGALPGTDRSLDVGVDCFDFTPVTFDSIRLGPITQAWPGIQSAVSFKEIYACQRPGASWSDGVPCSSRA